MFYPQAAPGFVGSVKLSVASAEAAPAYPGALPLAGPCTTAYLPFALDSAPWFHLAPSSGSRSLILRHTQLAGGRRMGQCTLGKPEVDRPGGCVRTCVWLSAVWSSCSCWRSQEQVLGPFTSTPQRHKNTFNSAPFASKAEGLGSVTL